MYGCDLNLNFRFGFGIGGLSYDVYCAGFWVLQNEVIFGVFNL